MSQLTVQNGVLRFLGENIIIAHITSYKVLYIKRKLPKLHLRLSLILLAIGLVAGGIAWLIYSGKLSFFLDQPSFELASQATFLVLIVVGGTLFLLIGNRFRIFISNIVAPRAGLYLRIAGRDGRVFISEDRQMLLDIADAIEQAINSPGISITNNFQGNFHIEDADNVNFGAQIR